MSTIERERAQRELDEIGARHGEELELVREGDDAPMPWAVYVELGIGEQDMIGAGATPGDAVREAAATLAGWAS